MNAGMFRNPITFERNDCRDKDGRIVADEVGNVAENWAPYFDCHAYVNGLSGSEYWAAAAQHAESTVVFQVRYCDKLAAVTPQDYRIVFRGAVYDIQSADNVQFRNETIKFKAVVHDGGI